MLDVSLVPDVVRGTWCTWYQHRTQNTSTVEVEVEIQENYLPWY